jgi:hypothetical protein
MLLPDQLHYPGFDVRVQGVFVGLGRLLATSPAFLS